MALYGGDIRVKISGDNLPLKKSLDTAGKSIGDFKKKFDGIAKTITKSFDNVKTTINTLSKPITKTANLLHSGFTKAHAAVNKVFDTTKKYGFYLGGAFAGSMILAIKQANDFEKSLKKIELVTNNNKKEIKELTDLLKGGEIFSLADQLSGIATGRSLGLNSGDIQKLFQPLKDAAAVTGYGLEDSFSAIVKALRGETDPAENLGLKLTENALLKEANELYGEQFRQEQKLNKQREIEKELKADIQSFDDRESLNKDKKGRKKRVKEFDDELMLKKREMERAAKAELAEGGGKVRLSQLTQEQQKQVILLGTMRQLQKFKGGEAKMLQTTGGQWQRLKGIMQDAIGTLGTGFKQGSPATQGLKMVGDILAKNMQYFYAFGQLIARTMNYIGLKIRNTFGQIKSNKDFQEFFKSLEGWAKYIVDKVGAAFTWLYNNFTRIATNIYNTAASVWTTLSNFGEGIKNIVVAVWDNVVKPMLQEAYGYLFNETEGTSWIQQVSEQFRAWTEQGGALDFANTVKDAINGLIDVFDKLGGMFDFVYTRFQELKTIIDAIGDTFSKLNKTLNPFAKSGDPEKDNEQKIKDGEKLNIGDSALGLLSAATPIYIVKKFFGMFGGKGIEKGAEVLAGKGPGLLKQLWGSLRGGALLSPEAQMYKGILGAPKGPGFFNILGNASKNLLTKTVKGGPLSLATLGIVAAKKELEYFEMLKQRDILRDLESQGSFANSQADFAAKRSKQAGWKNKLAEQARNNITVSHLNVQGGNQLTQNVASQLALQTGI